MDKVIFKPTKLELIGLCILCALIGFCMSENMHDSTDHTKFKVIQAGSYHQMEYEINILIKDGWKLHGGLESFAFPDPSSQSGIALQITQIIVK